MIDRVDRQKALEEAKQENAQLREENNHLEALWQNMARDWQDATRAYYQLKAEMDGLAPRFTREILEDGIRSMERHGEMVDLHGVISEQSAEIERLWKVNTEVEGKCGKLSSEITSLREALESIANLDVVGDIVAVGECGNLAREALQKKEGE